MIIDNEYEIGEMVYIKTDIDQYLCIITNILISKNEIIYFVTRNTETIRCYEFEITKNKTYNNL